MSKMSGKQKVVGDFDLNSFVGAADEPATNPKEQIKRRQTPARPKPADPVTERVQVMLTKKEMDAIRAKAGLVPVSKWLRHELKERGII